MDIDTLMAQKNALINKLDSLSKVFGKEFSKGVLEPARNFPVPDVIETGIPEIDYRILSIGGLPVGRAIEIAGETSSGKSTLALNFCRKAIERELSVVIAENEGSFTYEYGEKIGLDPDKYMIFKGSGLSGGEYLDGILTLIEAGFDIVVLDSITGIIADKVSETSFDDFKMNIRLKNAQLVADFFRMLKGGWYGKLKENSRKIIKMVDSRTTLIVINHLKEVISDGWGGGPDKESSGSVDIKFLYSYRLWLERLGMSKDVDEQGDPIYTRVRITGHKARLSPPGRTAIMYIDNRDGRFLSGADAILKSALRKHIVIQSGAWILFNEELDLSVDGFEGGKRFNGKANFSDYCNHYSELLKYIMGF